jgi:hypothetical protein
MKTLATEAEVDEKGWLNIHTPAPPGIIPGKLEVVVVFSPLILRTAIPIHPQAGTLPEKVELSTDFHAPLEDFRAYAE